MMRIIKFIAVCLLLTSALSAKALVISDVHSFNRPLINTESVNILFNLADHGYDHRTDSITSIKLSFDFREIVETEEDFSNVDDMSTWEFIIFYSWVFDGRDIYADIDTGIKTYERFWEKTYECQFTPWESEDCQENLDLDGIMSSRIVAYNNNLWLGDARLDVEVNRVPEPAPVLLFGLGLMGLAIRTISALKQGNAAQ